jgi:deoxyuridine 5'-triphosphate nucleotidohydrolase
MIYLAGAIENASIEEASEWRRYAATKLERVFDPLAAFGSKKGGTIAMQRANNAAIAECSAVLANLEAGVPSTTFEEIDLAIKLGKRVAIYCRDEQYSKSGASIFDSLTDAINFLQGASIEESGQPMRSAGQLAQEEALASSVPQMIFVVDQEAIPNDWQPELPKPSYKGDVGYDLPAAESVVLMPGQTTKVRLAFRIEPPPGYWWRLVGRSSTWRNLGCIVHEGIIDNGYRGPLWAGIHNPNEDPVYVAQGDRLVQCIPQREVEMQPVLGTKMSDSERGESGFGSSGQ